ncbi:TonB-dependent siderophore receptor [Agaribacterium sp. ZY112]|uniref:TonB-dependent siderophore receptor n=1 Tax=Agaribacterium sp. ZY112 TaxID=3233574 RepID=UPI00352506B0
MNKQVTQALMLGSVAISFFNCGFVNAQSNDKTEQGIETVTVIGMRQAYQGDFAELEIPQAELKIDSQVLQDAGALDLVQALDLSASVARQNNFGGLWNSFAIRGFVGDENLPSNYLVNGFNAGRGFGGARDLSGIESVEVLKGPRAALFGRGEPGGTINLVTKRPTFEREGEIRLSAGSFDTYRTDLDWTSPLTDDVAVRIVGFYEDAGSFRDTIESTKQGLSPSLTWRVNQQSQLTYELEYSHQETPFDRGVVAVGLEGEEKKLGVIPQSRFLGEPDDGPMKADVLGHQLEFQHDFNDNWSALLGFNSRDTSLEGNATENGFYGSRQFLQLDGEHLTRFRRYRDYDARYQVLRAEISGLFSTAAIQHRLIIGVDADKFENDQVFLRARGEKIDDSKPVEDELDRLAETNQVINIFDPVYGAYPLPVPQPNTDRLETQESLGFYIQDQMSLTNKLDVRIGARFDDYQQELDNRRSGEVDQYSETRVSPQFGVVYKATDAISVYSAYGENFRPLSGATSSNNLEPNQSTSTEIGIKFALNDGALQGTVAVFDVQQSNISTVDADFNATAIGEAESQGLEVDINGQLTNTLNLWLSYAYTDAKTKNAFYDANFGVEVPAGAELLNIPENQLSLQLVKQTQLIGKDLDLIAGVIYVDDRNGFFSDQDFRLPSYTTTRIAANYRLSELLELSAEVNNVFDETYYTNSFADVWVQPGAPRNVLLSARFSF